MAKFLKDLLDAEEPLFTTALRQLEYVSGRTGADTKLIGDITAMAHENMRAMGLTPAVATGEEVYYALQARVEQDIERLTKVIGAKETDDVAHLVPYMVDAANGVKFNRKVFVLKREKAKELLREMPPKALMERLGYDDIEKMFEQEDFDEIYTALRFSEGPEWLNEYNELFKTVTADDYEERDLRILQMDHKKYVDLAAHFVKKKLHNVTHTKEMGTIVVVPMHAKKMRGLVLKTLPLLLHYMNEVKLYSTFFKLKSKKPHFGKVVMETLIADPGNASQMVGHKVHWRVIQRYLGKHKEDSIDKVAFEPHVQPEDLHWRRAEDLLYQIDPELEFWKDRDYVGVMYDGFPVAFNLFDVSFAYSNQEPYEGRYAYHFRESLWNEIFVRYMGFKNLSEQVLEQLDNDMIAPEKLDLPKAKAKASKVPALKAQNAKSDLLIRRKLIDAAEGRLGGVIEEFESAFELLGKHEKTVTIFGSARKPQDDEVTKSAYDVAQKLAEDGFTVVTGGGHGVMEAANRGAYDVGGQSIGLNILLPFEQTLNEYTTESFQFDHFFGRKVSMTLDASAFVFFPGGFGTFDELFEILALEQTHKIPKAPVILVGSDFWKPLDELIRSLLLDRYQTISEDDLKLYTIVDDYESVIKQINRYEAKQNKTK
ncbi:TIGR00730 family Rossman fold protein [Candidatus Saccharibacteria bacterium]|nr:TIGR00730 family Rossman fold protein [Candidatus Saccharibacteria bacterium]|tara:strand:+ start:928 stop:2889 length:1962 start_codon:yes stop_codon:yes gene_type:complete